MQRAQQRCCSTIQTLIILLSFIHAATAQQAAGTGNSTAAAAAAVTPTRFFIDEGFFLEGDTEILRAHISAAAGRLTISGESSAAFLSVKGYYSPDTWDVYWTIRSACQMAYKHMGPHQLVNCIPGVSAMSLKRNFVSTWQQAYGELAYNFIPRSYLIPEQYWVWRNHLLASGSPSDRKWVLKANIHRGKGVSVVPQQEALREALTHSREHSTTVAAASSSSSSSSDVRYLNVLVQSYLQQQLVIGGRSSYIRVWLLVTSINPLRAYLYHGGFAIFGKQKAAAAAYAAAAASSSYKTVSAGSSSSSSTRKDDLIVNLWIQDRDNSPIWSLARLEQYLTDHPDTVLPLPAVTQQQHQQQQSGGRLLLQANTSSSGGGPRQQQQQQHGRRRTFADAWSDMRVSASLVLAAALPAMRASAKSLNAPASGTFEYFGIDFVLDAHLKPWMLEVNAIPSLARRKKSDCSGARATADCKLTSTTNSSSNSSSSSSSSSKGAGGGDHKSGAAAAGEAAADDFDAQKELFVHDMLMLLGLPVDANSNNSTATGTAAAAAAAAAGSLSGAAGVLRMAAAAAAAADIRSPARPAPAAAKKTGTSSSGSSSNSDAADRRLLSQGHAHSSRQQQQQQQRRPLWRQLQQHVRHVRQHVRPHPHHRAHHSATSRLQRSSTRSSSSGSTSSKSSSSSTGQLQQWYKGVVGLQWPGPAPDLKQLPAQIQKLLCPASSSSSSSTVSGEFACVSCLTADDLAALAAAEAELQRAGNLEPVHDLITAHAINTQALGKSSAAAGNSSSSSSSIASEERQPPPAAADAPAGEVDAAAAAGDLYLSQNPSVWQKLHRAWLGMSRGQVGLRDLAVMQHYTASATVSAEKGLGLQRLDYVMSAWLRVRQQEECAGASAAADCVGKRLSLLVSKCYS